MEPLNYVRANWDRCGAWAAIALGGLAIVIGWLGVSDTGFVFEQLPYVVSGGIGGLFLLGIGVSLLLSADLRDEWRKLDAIERHLAGAASETAAVEDTAVAPREEDAPTPPSRRRAKTARADA